MYLFNKLLGFAIDWYRVTIFVMRHKTFVAFQTKSLWIETYTKCGCYTSGSYWQREFS